jgi:hypothetical protein
MKQVSTRSAGEQSEMFRFAQHDRGTALAFWGCADAFRPSRRVYFANSRNQPSAIEVCASLTS